MKRILLQTVACLIVLNGCAILLAAQTESSRLPNESLDDFGKSSPNFIRARLDNLFYYLTEQAPKYEGLIVITFDKKSSRNYRISRIRLLLEHIKFRQFDATRISFYFLPDRDQERTIVRTIPPGFSDYGDIRVDPSKFIKAEEISSKLKTLFH